MQTAKTTEDLKAQLADHKERERIRAELARAEERERAIAAAKRRLSFDHSASPYGH